MSYGELSNTQETMVLPMLQMKNIRGKPYITVSAKGMVNGLSNIPNDGADFGPDTTKGATAPGQYGGTYTETVGIQEAGNYAFSQYSTVTAPSGIVIVPSIYIMEGAYNINSPISWDPSSYIPSGYSLNDLHLEFDPNALINYDGTGYCITIAANSSTTNMGLYINLIDGVIGSTATGLIKWVFTSSSSSAYAIITNSNNSTITSSQYFCYFRGQLSVTIKNNVAGGIVHANCTQYIVIDTPFFQYGNAGYYEVNAPFMYIRGIRQISGVTTAFANAETAIYEMIDGTIFSFARQTVVRGGDNVTLSLNTIKVKTLSVEDVTGPSSGAFISAVTSAGTQTIGTLRCRNVIAGYSDATFIDTTDLSISDYDIKVGVDAVHSYTFASIPVNTPTTPSVPTSATAQENTNPYPVDVYVYGGDVTEIQITRNGTAYTVFSVSTAIAMSGQHFPLNNTDSITITYSTAPTWEWLSD